MFSFVKHVFNSELNSRLKANNKDFYFDYKDGKYGYNTSSNRGADTFHPFKGGEFNITVGASGIRVAPSLKHTFSKGRYIIYTGFITINNNPPSIPLAKGGTYATNVIVSNGTGTISYNSTYGYWTLDASTEVEITFSATEGQTNTTVYKFILFGDKPFNEYMS